MKSDLRPRPKRFKSRGNRDAYYRNLDHRTDKKARRNRALIALDLERLASALPSHTNAPQAGR